MIIGGTACSELIGNRDLKPRATKDIDAVLIVEALSADFVRRFWEFIKEGEYTIWQTAAGKTQFYRFMMPETEGFPLQIELFSRVSDMIQLPDEAHLTPIPVDEELSSLSAILLDEDCYNYTVSHTVVLEDLHFADRDAIVVLKTIAYINNSNRKAEGKNVHSEDISKHKNDIFRLVATFTPNDRYGISDTIKDNLRRFLEMVEKKRLATEVLSKELGFENVITFEVF